MKTQTIKLKKDEFTDIDLDSSDVIILTGARRTGKSYPTAQWVKRMLMDDPNNKYMYMRISQDELSTYAGWAKDIDPLEIAQHDDPDVVSVSFDRGKPRAGDISIKGFDAEDKPIYNRVIGKAVYLTKAGMTKSDNFDDFKAIVFEEFTRPNMSRRMELDYVTNFQEAVITVFGVQRPKKIFMISNSFKNIPLLESRLKRWEGIRINEIHKYKIFREMSQEEREDAYLAYINGEVYDAEEFIIDIKEFKRMYVNNRYEIFAHLIHRNKYYIRYNKGKKTMAYDVYDLIRIKDFLRTVSAAEFYYASVKLEYEFSDNYEAFQGEIMKLVLQNRTVLGLDYWG